MKNSRLRVDLLVVGGSTAGFEIALRERRNGRSVLMVTPYSYFGEDLCAGLNLRAAPRWLRNAGLPETPTPMAIKRLLDRIAIETPIDFLLQTWPVKLLANGLAVANKSGLVEINTGCIVDATLDATVARMSHMPFRAPTAGNRTAFRRVLTESAEPADFVCEGRHYRLEEKYTTVTVADASAITARFDAEIDARLKTWNHEQKLTADRTSFDFGDGACGPDPDQRIFLPEQYSGIMREPVTETASGERLALPLLAEFDVVIVGGGTAGAAAGIAAARAGAKTLVIEQLSHLGGLGTQGRIASYYFGLDIGFTCELNAEVAKFPDSTYPPRRWAVEAKQFCWEKLSRTAGVAVWLESFCFGCNLQAGKITELDVATPYGTGKVRGMVFVDSTGNAELAAFCHAPTEFSSCDEPAYQGTGMSPVVPGHDYFNTDYLFVVDSDNRDVTGGFLTGRDRYPEQFDLAQMPGTRERRRIIGDLVLRPSDFFARRSYPDTIALAFSNFDTHGFTVDPLLLFRSVAEEPYLAEIPLRALLSPGIANLMTTGLGISAHRDAMPLIRMQADVQNQGYAAGIVAAAAVRDGLPLRKLDLPLLRQQLRNAGFLGPVPGIDGKTPNEDALLFSSPNPERLLPDFQRKPEFESALRLALLGSDAGAKLLCGHVRNSLWDQGWNYTGMGQFGRSASRMDIAIMALSRLTVDWSFLRDRLNELTPESEFSHYRACALFMMRHPDLAAVPKLAELLETFHCHAIGSYREALNSSYPAGDDVAERNVQLRELYLSGALYACDRNHLLAKEFLMRYRDGLHRLYAIFAEKWLIGG